MGKHRRLTRAIGIGLVALGGAVETVRAQELQTSSPQASPRAAFSCPVSSAGGSEPLDIVRYLADDALEGRFSGTRGAQCAGDFIAARFAELGLEPAGDGGFFQSLELASAATPHAPIGTGRNVLALLRGADPELSESAVVLGAHYDHLGHGEFGSTGQIGEVHNGADDNASGVATMLEVARRLAAGPRPARSILFIAFTGEELGLIGSGYYARNPRFPMSRTLGMVNLDMVGRLGDDPLIVYGMGTAPEWAEIVARSNRAPEIPLVFEQAGYGPSDHTSFYASDVPVLHLFTNVHGDYHKPTDDWERIDPAGLERIAVLTSNIVHGLASRPTRLTLVPGIGEREQRSGGYDAWLGTVPDFTPVDAGVLIAGVTAGSPGEAVGLRKGDVLVRLGVHEIADLQGFTDALRAHRPGDEVLIVFLREGETHSVETRLGDRADRPE